jgi:hypothetical protein
MWTSSVQAIRHIHTEEGAFYTKRLGETAQLQADHRY